MLGAGIRWLEAARGRRAGAAGVFGAPGASDQDRPDRRAGAGVVGPGPSGAGADR
ncbi:hypothetical protein GCM10009680_80520 [Streptomyces yatensis]|uniref:Uncharacterized protein n=1 Tax=Streptomyces yatensis TaxID=155177 RepID=A0ABP4VKT7_9ACTN